MQTEFYSGDWLHKRCRCDYISEYYIDLHNTSNYEQDNLARRTRSFPSSFDFRSNCFLCGSSISQREKRNGSNIVFDLCKYREVDNQFQMQLKNEIMMIGRQLVIRFD